MILSYRLVSVPGQYTAIFDESTGAVNEKFNPAFIPTVQKAKLAGGTNWFRNPLGNIAVTHTFKFSVNYATPDAALAAITAFAAFLNVKIHLMVQQGATVQFYPNAVAQAPCQPDMQGQEVAYTLSYESDNVQALPP